MSTDLDQMMAQQLAAQSAPAAPTAPPAPAGLQAAVETPVPPVAPSPEPPSPDPTAPVQPPTGPSLDEIQAQLQQMQEKDRLNEEKLARYAELEQRMTAEQTRRQAEQVRAQVREDLKQTYTRLVDAENDDAAVGLLEQLLRRYVEPVQQHAAQQVEAVQAQYQRELGNYANEVESALREAFRPGLAREIATQYQLPEPYVELLAMAPDAELMPQMAARFQQLIAQQQPAAAQQLAASQAHAHRQANTFAVAGAGGAPMPALEVQPMAATSPESLSTLQTILGWRAPAQGR